MVSGLRTSGSRKKRERRTSGNGKKPGEQSRESARQDLSPRWAVAAGSRAEAKTISNLIDDVFGRVLVLTRAGEDKWTPDPASRLAAGDELLVVATRRGLGELVRRSSRTGKELVP